MNLVPTWGGSMFEALMVPLLVPEEEWGTGQLGRQPPAVRRGPRSSTASRRPATATGASRPSNNPDGGYREYGVDPIGLDPNGYASDQERTLRRLRLRGLPAGRRRRPPTTAEGVVTPHASFLALDFDRDAALANLANLRRGLRRLRRRRLLRRRRRASTARSRATTWRSTRGWSWPRSANELDDDRLQQYFAAGSSSEPLRPLMAHGGVHRRRGDSRR